MHRLKGELLLMQDAPNTLEAEHCFRTAIEGARRQAGRSLNCGRPRVWRGCFAERVRRAEARTMLAEIYGWFTEGFDTADLKDAKALLEEMRT